MKSLASESVRWNGYLKFGRLSRSSRLAQPGIALIQKSNFSWPFMCRTLNAYTLPENCWGPVQTLCFYHVTACTKTRNGRNETTETSETTETTETKRLIQPKQAKRPKRAKINEKVKKLRPWSLWRYYGSLILHPWNPCTCVTSWHYKFSPGL